MKFFSSQATLALVSLYFVTLTQAEQPCIYRGSESPCYEVISTFRDESYELRRYGPSVWVKTKAKMAENYWEDESNQSFWTLFRYISGANKEGKKIEMTSPVLKSHTQDEVDMYFMLPSANADNPPTPTAAGVEIFYNPGGEFYVRKFGGWPSVFGFNRSKQQLALLKKDLDDDKKTYDKDLFFTAGYNSPYTLFKRRNEVWVPKKN